MCAIGEGASQAKQCKATSGLAEAHHPVVEAPPPTPVSSSPDPRPSRRARHCLWEAVASQELAPVGHSRRSARPTSSKIGSQRSRPSSVGKRLQWPGPAHRPAQDPVQVGLEELENFDGLAAPEGRKASRLHGLGTWHPQRRRARTFGRQRGFPFPATTTKFGLTARPPTGRQTAWGRSAQAVRFRRRRSTGTWATRRLSVPQAEALKAARSSSTTRLRSPSSRPLCRGRGHRAPLGRRQDLSCTRLLAVDWLVL